MSQQEKEVFERRISKIKGCLKKLTMIENQSDMDSLIIGLQSFQNIIKNIIKYPNEESYRIINLSNQMMKVAVLTL